MRLQTLYPSTTSSDPTWDKIPSAIYSLVEVTVGITCASVVTLRPLYHCLRRPFIKKNETPQPPGIRRYSFRRRPRDDLVLMTGDTSQLSSEAHEVELSRVELHSECSTAGGGPGNIETEGLPSKSRLPN